MNSQFDLKKIASSASLQYLLILILLVPLLAHLNKLPDAGAAVISDSFRYLWKNEISSYFFQASSITVRSINLLLNNNPVLIGYYQLFLAFLPGVFIYLALKRDNNLFNLILIVAIAIIYSSPGIVRYHDVVNSESVYASLFISFPLVLFGYTGRFRMFFLLVIGVLFIFSRNPAPYIVLVQLLIYSIVKGAQMRDKRMLYSWIFLFITALTALIMIQKYDTTKEINVADNLFSRVFQHPEKVAYFHKQYGMPLGPFIMLCKRGGSNINHPCVDHQSIYTGDDLTRQYRLTNDNQGFADWVRHKGMKSWQDFILFRDTENTIKQMNSGFPSLASEMFNILTPNPERDPLVLLGRLYNKVGALTLVGLLVYIAIGIAVYYVIIRHKGLEIGLILMISVLPAFFIGYFGDSEEIRRYTFPAILCLYIGLLIYFTALVEILVSYAYRSWKHGPG